MKKLFLVLLSCSLFQLPALAINDTEPTGAPATKEQGSAYLSLYKYPNGYTRAQKANKQYVLLDKEGKEVSAEYYGMSEIYADDRIKVSIRNTDKVTSVISDRLHGYITGNGKEVISCKYLEARDFRNGIAQVEIYTEPRVNNEPLHWKVIDPDENMVFQRVRAGERMYGVVDRNFKQIIKPEFQHIRESSGVFIVHTKTATGIYNFSGKEIIKPEKYWDLTIAQPGYYLAFVRSKPKNKLTLLDEQSRELVALDTFTVLNLKDNYIIAAYGYSNMKLGVFDLNGYKLIPIIYDRLVYIGEKIFAVKADGRKQWGYIDDRGKEVLPMAYDSIRAFSNGRSTVYQNGKAGSVNSKGKFVIPLKYDKIFNTTEGMTTVMLNKRYGFLDEAYAEATKIIYESVTNFSNGRSEVVLNGEKFFIDKKGNKIVEAPEDETTSWTARIKNNPADFEAYLHRGIIYFEKKKYELALEDLSRSIKSAPDYLYGNAYYYRAEIYYLQKKYEQALADANKFVELNQHMRSMPDALVLRAKIYCSLGLKSAAKSDEERAIELEGEVKVRCN